MSINNEKYILYVLLCEERKLFAGITKFIDKRLKEQFDLGSKTSKVLIKHKPVLTLKKSIYKIKKNALREVARINSLEGNDVEKYIISCTIKNRRNIIITQLSGDLFGITCPSCCRENIITCLKSEIYSKSIKFQCICEIIRRNINDLFEQVMLGIVCMGYGKFIFKGKDDDAIRDSILGFSNRGERRRALNAYHLIDDISFKNTYLLLASILEECYNLIKEHSKNSSGDEQKIVTSFTKNTFDKNKNELLRTAKNVRYTRFAHFVVLVSNVLKHTGGVIKDDGGSGTILIKKYKCKENMNIVDFKNIHCINGSAAGNILYIMSRLYVFMFDLSAHIFGLKKFRVNRTLDSTIEEQIMNYQIREEFNNFLLSIDDGSVDFR